MFSPMKALVLALALTPSFALADRYEGDRVSSAVTFSGEAIRKELSSDFALTTNVYRVEQQLRYQSVPRVQEVCTGSEGDGSQGNWHNFYNVPKAEKAQALSNAIKGVGNARAQKLVKYFDGRPKPRSWDEFSGVIRTSEREIPGISQDVLVNFGADNRQNLGYNGTRTCQNQIVGYDQVPVMVDVRIPLGQLSRKFRVISNDQKLLKGDKDQVAVAFDGYNDALDAAYYNNSHDYKVFRDQIGDTVVYRLEATRKLRAAQHSLTVRQINEGGKLVLEITDNQYSPEVARGLGNGTVSIIVKQNGGFLGLGSKVLRELSARLNGDSAVTRVETGVDIPAGKEIKSETRLQRQGSEFFNDQLSPEGETGYQRLR